MQNLKISLITTSYNSEITISDTLSSVLFQSYSNIEYIIVDGGSSDETISIIKEALIYNPTLSVWVITKSNSSEDPRGFNIKFKIKIMKKQIENFIVKCVCKGIEMYVSQHRFGFNGMLEMLPLTNEDFKKHLSKQLTEEAAKSYLETVPTIHPQEVQ